jgi:Fe2+ or Zn2+ uptake regulation protein
MIQKSSITSDYLLICDICGEGVDNLDDFHEAKEYAKENGWKIQKVADGWEDICPECQ